MKRIFLDTNIIVDLLMQREGVVTSAKVLSKAKKEEVSLLVSVLTIANIAQILRKVLAGRALYVEMAKLVNFLDVVDLKKEHLFSTLELEAKDFEDALQYYCACDNDCDIIVTRNKKDFDFSTIEVLTPEEFLQKY